MYSMVMMMAVASGGDAATFHKKGTSCTGYSSCSGYVAPTVTYAAPVSYGCSGSSCHGGGLFSKHSTGCCGGGGLFSGGLFKKKHSSCHGSMPVTPCGDCGTHYYAPTDPCALPATTMPSMPSTTMPPKAMPMVETPKKSS